MNKSNLKNFAIEARNVLMGKIEDKLHIIGISKDGVSKVNALGNDVEINGKLYNKKSYDALITKYKELGYKELIEESAYTWFNRLTALAYMECNQYIDEKLIYSTTSKTTPDIIDNYMDAEFFQNFDEKLKNKIHELRDNHNLEEMHSILVEGKCRELSKIMPFMFSETGDYAEILFPAGLLIDNSILMKLRKEIVESKEKTETGEIVPVELIGWLYQYYNSEKREVVYDGSMKKDKISKEFVPAATQLFTPDWIVKYMVENSLGKLAVESLGVGDSLKKNWRYYIESGIDNTAEKLKVEEIKIIDPAMGSGHILTYSFDVLFDIYESLGWGKKDAVLSILKNNICGLEIDERAGQLASFAIMMKGREKFPRLFKVLERLEEEERFNLNLLVIQESNSIAEQTRKLIVDNSLNNLKELIENFHDAKEYGSILKLEKIEIEDLKEEFKKLKELYEKSGQSSMFSRDSHGIIETLNTWEKDNDFEKIEKLIVQQNLMIEKYDVVITNPPYMGNSRINGVLKKYVESYYEKVKSDLFAVFFIKCCEMAKENGHLGFMSPFVWMFIKSYEELRIYFIEKKTITSLIQLEYSGFEDATVPICTFTLQNKPSNRKGEYIKLSDFKGAKNQPIKTLEAIENSNCGWRFQANQKEFKKIPGSPIAYWVSDRVREIFEKNDKLGDIGDAKVGLQTGDNDRFLRLWNEVNYNKIGYGMSNSQEALESGKKWFPYNKGGEKRKWYGNQEYLVNWENDGYEIKNFYDDKGKLRSRPQNLEFYFRESISWGLITSAGSSFRYFPNGFIHDVGGMCYFPKHNLNNLLGILNTNIYSELTKILNPTINLQIGDVVALPAAKIENITFEKLVEENIKIAKEEWNLNETSWDFEISPLLNNSSLSTAYENYCKYWRDEFVQMHKNEEELNKIFIEIYELESEMDEKVDFEDITLLKKETTINKMDTPELSQVEFNENEKTSIGYLQNRGVSLEFNKEEIVKQFLSYGVGCIMGRYSIDKGGLIIANSDDEMEVLENKIVIKSANKEIRHEIHAPKFIPDSYGIIPVVKEDIFENDIVRRIVEFVEAVYGKETLEENLNFIGEALGKKNNENNRDVIRKYFIKGFYKDHLQRYKKRPIYWMMNSGKKDAFGTLIYLHRYNEDSIGRVRADYLLKYQEMLDNQRASIERLISDEGTLPKDKKDGEKKLKELDGDLKELKDYANEVKHIADKKIRIDLDDGVKVNYEKFEKIMGKI